MNFNRIFLLLRGLKFQHKRIENHKNISSYKTQAFHKTFFFIKNFIFLIFLHFFYKKNLRSPNFECILQQCVLQNTEFKLIFLLLLFTILYNLLRLCFGLNDWRNMENLHLR